jgi:nucleoside-diphosphate-sugar epimerase
MNRIIIGCGYVGMAVARHWQQQGITVTATTTTPARLAELEAIAAHAVLVNGNDEATLASVLEHQQVVLLSIGARNAEVYQDTYLTTAKTLATVLSQNSSVQQLIYTGSYAVYGDRQGEWVTEDMPVSPANRNGEILAETEQVLLGISRADRQVCVFRLGGIYGPGRELVKIFGRAAGKPRAGNGDEASNWVHLDDIVGAIEFASVHRLQGIYNLVQDTPIPTRELLDRVFTQHNLPGVSWDPSLPNTRPYNARVSNKKLRDAGYSMVHQDIEV